MQFQYQPRDIAVAPLIAAFVLGSTLLATALADQQSLYWTLQDPTQPRAASLLGSGWRHNHEWLLTQDNADQLVLFDPHGNTTRFFRNPDDASADVSRFVSEHGHVLEQRGSRFHLAEFDDASLLFEGSAPIEIRQKNGSTVSFRYRDGKLDTLVVDDTNHYRFNYQQQRLVSVSDSTGSAIALPSLGDAEGLCTANPVEVCDAESSPPDEAFTAGPSIFGAINRDLRPANCNSYFTMYRDLERGNAIEHRLAIEQPYAAMQNTIRTFPVVDFFDQHRMVIATSRDLSDPSYDGDTNPDALFARIVRDAGHWQTRLLDRIHDTGYLEASELGQTTRLTIDDLRPPELHLIVQHGMASRSQQTQIERARQHLWQKYGLQLVVIEIP